MLKKVLIAEDQADVRKMMKILLNLYGYEVLEASSGYDAVETAVTEKPDLILMDLAMPLMDGVAATDAIRRHEDLADVPIIAVTAYSDFYDKPAKAAGCNEVIQKPLDFERLKPLVRRYVH